MYHLLLGLEMSWQKGLTSIIGGSITAPSPSKENELLELKGRKSILLILNYNKTRTLWRGAVDHLVLVRFERRLVLHSAQEVESPEHDCFFL